MMATQNDDNLSDDEIFFGKLSLGEVKKHVMGRYYHSETGSDKKMEDNDSSIKIIETCSEPDLKSIVYVDDSDAVANFSKTKRKSSKEDDSWNIGSGDNSFLEMEKMVSELNELPNNNIENLDNTLDVVEYILNNAPGIEDENKLERKTQNIIKSSGDKTDLPVITVETLNPIMLESKEEVKSKEVKISPKKLPLTPVKMINDPSLVKSPVKIISLEKTGIFSTPNSNIKQKNSVFKTPKPTISLKKQNLTPNKTPCKSNSYQHIASPVATYIKQSPQVPLLQEVRPRKPLPGISSIPTLVKSIENKANKENMCLPLVAYKSAKNIKVIKVPHVKKLPESQWAKKVSQSKPVVIKHDHRENNLSQKTKLPDDSFANLTLHQAELSVCIEKPA